MPSLLQFCPSKLVRLMDMRRAQLFEDALLNMLELILEKKVGLSSLQAASLSRRP